MSISDNSNKQDLTEFFSAKGRLKRTGMTFGIVGTYVFVFAGLGWWIDASYGTKPWFMVGLLLASIPLGQYHVYRAMKHYANKAIRKNP